MMYRSVSAVLLALILPTAAVAAPVAAPSVRTVYGMGPEIHLLPDYGPVGTTVQVYGLGYRPGAQVRIVYGAVRAEFMPSPLATAVVSPQGRFHVSFRVTCGLVVIRMNPPRTCSLSGVNPYRLVAIGGFAGYTFAHKRTAVTGFTVTG
jgi:hypothetical protein